MPRFSLKGLWDGLFGSSKYDLEDFPISEEKLQASQFCLADTVRHGFPDRPTAVAYDPLQKLLAIGTYYGSLTILGQAGVICRLQHDRVSPVVEVTFLSNDGALVTVCADGFLRLWNLRQGCPEVVRAVQFQREKITSLLIPFRSKWVYVGTDKGNMHVLHVESFALSGYVIYWNKVIPLSQRTHPGILSNIYDCPTDPNKLLLGYSTGLLVLWALRTRSAGQHWAAHAPLTSVCWLSDGKHFMSAHVDGALCTWHVKTARLPTGTTYPHGDTDLEVRPSCEPIRKLVWSSSSDGEPFVIFSGGMPTSSVTAGLASVTVLRGETVSVVEMENDVLDLCPVISTPYTSEYQDPSAVVVLLRDAMAVLDLSAPGCCSLPSPHPDGLHLSPVTSCHLVTGCSTDLMQALRDLITPPASPVSVQTQWPITGGTAGRIVRPSDPLELLITGHVDGSVKFWDVSGAQFQLLYKIRTTRVIEKSRRCTDQMVLGHCSDPLAIERIAFCTRGRLLAVAGAASQVIVYRFGTLEGSAQTPSVEIPWPVEHAVNGTAADADDVEDAAEALHEGSSPDAEEVGSGDTCTVPVLPVRCRQTSVRRSVGFQPVLVCISAPPTPAQYTSGLYKPPETVNVLALNSADGVMACGVDSGLALVDLIGCCCMLVGSTVELHSPELVPELITLKQPSQAGCSSRRESCDDILTVPDGGRRRGSLFPAIPRRKSSTSSASSDAADVVSSLHFTQSSTGQRGDESPGGPAAAPQLQLLIGSSSGAVRLLKVAAPSPVDPAVPWEADRGPITVTTELLLRAEGGVVVSLSEITAAGDTVDAPYTLWTTDSWNRPDSSEHGSAPAEVTSHVLVVTSETMVQTVELPSRSLLTQHQVTERSCVVRARVISMPLQQGVGTTTCLVCYTADGWISAYCLPSLRPLLTVYLKTFDNPSLLATLCIGDGGAGLFVCSPSEIQKFTISAQCRTGLSELLPVLFVARETPEAPSPGIIQSLFGSAGSRSLDRDQLFGSTAGKPRGGTVQSFGGASVDGLLVSSASAGGAVSAAHRAAVERGERLSQLQDRTEQLSASAQQFSGASSQLAEKYRNKKWWQF